MEPCVIQPDLYSDEYLSWSDVKPEEIIVETIYIENRGDANTELDWEICEYPSWGTWNFEPQSGTDLRPEDGPFTIEVTVVAPNQQNKQFNGDIKIVNKENNADFYKIPVYLKTPRNHPVIFQKILQVLRNLFSRFQLFEQLLNLH
jgi:hypothetical protein